MTKSRVRMTLALCGPIRRAEWLPLPVHETLHEPRRFLCEEGLSEHADAEIDGFRQRQLFPLPQERFLRAQRLGAAFEQHLDDVLNGCIEATLRRDPVDQPPGK